MIAEKIAEEVLSLYIELGRHEYIGEPVNQFEHMSQAAQLAIDEGYDDEVVLAAFFHDIGHLCVNKNADNDLNGFGIKNHEQVGAKYLMSLGFPDRILRLVAGHVEAKRYLCYKFPEYFNKLSEASKETLKFQGGVMHGSEADEFEQNPLRHLMIKMREWDDAAKKEHVPLIGLETIRSKMVKVLESKRKT